MCMLVPNRSHYVWLIVHIFKTPDIMCMILLHLKAVLFWTYLLTLAPHTAIVNTFFDYENEIQVKRPSITSWWSSLLLLWVFEIKICVHFSHLWNYGLQYFKKVDHALLTICSKRDLEILTAVRKFPYKIWNWISLSVCMGTGIMDLWVSWDFMLGIGIQTLLTV